MKGKNEPKNELVPVQPKDINIPTSKLGYKQQESYREYGKKIIKDIRNMVCEINSHKEAEYSRRNRDELKKVITKDNAVHIKKLEAMNRQIKEIQTLESERKEEFIKADAEIEKIEALKRHAVTTYEQKITKRYEKVEKFRQELNGVDADVKGLCLRYIETTMTNKTIHNNRNVVLFVRSNELPELFDNDYISEKLREKFKESEQEIFVMKEQIKDLNDQFEEALLFDDTKIQPMFQYLLKLKNTLKEEYRSIMIS